MSAKGGGKVAVSSQARRRLPSMRDEGGRLRVAFVTETYPPEIGGAAMCASRFVQALRDHGHRVLLVRPRQGAEEEPPDGARLEHWLAKGVGVPFHPGLQLGLPAGRALERLWSEWSPDLVHVVSEGPLGWSAVRAARRLRVPVTSSFHTHFHRYGRHYGLGFLRGFGLAYLRVFHNGTARTLVPTTQVRDELARDGFRNLAVVSRGVDARLFDPARRRADLRARWGAGGATLVALVVGRLAPEKNLPLAVRAFSAIREKNPAARLVLVGEGPLRATLQRQHPQIHFTGMLRGEELAAHYASADLFLFPSLTETFGNVTLEAMASGLPVVAFDDAAAREHVRPFFNGLLAPRQAPEEFVAQALRLARQADLRARLGRGARETARALSWDAVGDAFEAVVREAALAGRPLASPSGRRADDLLQRRDQLA
jgi:glycosyltransferase involved in cell wall biosynthesis